MKNSLFVVPFFCVSMPLVHLKAQEEYGDEKRKPNIIYIYADDMGKGMLSAYGQRHFTTPHIDAMVTRGTSFDNAYGCMLSAPARASLLTGYHDCHPDKWMISKGGQFIPPTDNFSLIPALEKEIDDGDSRLGEGDYYLPPVFKKAG